MQKGKRIFLAVTVLIVVMVVSSIVTYAVTVHKMNTGEIYLQNDSYEELMQYYELKNVRQIIEEHYVSQLDDKQNKTLMHGAISGMMHSLGDGYSAFYTEEEYKSYFDEQLDGSYIAQGILLTPNEMTGYPVVKRVFADTAAYEAGIQVGDSILSIDQKEIYGEDINIILGYIRGLEGTSVILRIKRDGVEIEKELVRTSAQIQMVFTDTINEKVGYINVVEFTGNCAKDFEDALKSMGQENIEGLVIDLRGVCAGYIDEAVDAVDLLLDEGLIATSVSKGREVLRWESDEEVICDLPIAVLTDNATSGVAEVFAAAIQDRQRGIILGVDTKGVSASTTMFKIPSTGSVMKLVTAYYCTPNGKQIHGNGVKVDNVLDMGDGSAQGDTHVLTQAAEQLLIFMQEN